MQSNPVVFKLEITVIRLHLPIPQMEWRAKEGLDWGPEGSHSTASADTGFPEYLFRALMFPENTRGRCLMSLIWPLVYWELKFLKCFTWKRVWYLNSGNIWPKLSTSKRKTSGGSPFLVVSLCICEMDSTPTSCASQNTEGFDGGYRQETFLFLSIPTPFLWSEPHEPQRKSGNSGCLSFQKPHWLSPVLKILVFWLLHKNKNKNEKPSKNKCFYT